MMSQDEKRGTNTKQGQPTPGQQSQQPGQSGQQGAQKPGQKPGQQTQQPDQSGQQGDGHRPGQGSQNR